MTKVIDSSIEEIKKATLKWLDANWRRYSADRKDINLVDIELMPQDSSRLKIYFLTLTIPSDNVSFSFDLEDYFEDLGISVLVDLKAG